MTRSEEIKIKVPDLGDEALAETDDYYIMQTHVSWLMGFGLFQLLDNIVHDQSSFTGRLPTTILIQRSPRYAEDHYLLASALRSHTASDVGAIGPNDARTSKWAETNVKFIRKLMPDGDYDCIDAISGKVGCSFFIKASAFIGISNALQSMMAFLSLHSDCDDLRIVVEYEPQIHDTMRITLFLTKPERGQQTDR